jgi:hypothetical protein
MPSRLAVRNPQIRAQRRKASVEAFPVERIRATPPWIGFTPDLDPGQLGANAAEEIENLIARPVRGGGGEVLRMNDGFTMIDSARLPGVVGAGSGSVDANSALAVAGLGFFPRTDSAGARSSDATFTTMLVTAGDGSNAGSCQFWRVRPSTGQWQVVGFTGSGTAATGELPASGSAEGTVLVDWEVFQPGSPNRTIGAIAEPCFVWTNNDDEVYVYPHQTSGTSYEALTAFGTTFKARSVAAFAGRMNYLNTVESGTRFRYRLRRAHIGEADPNTSIGSGAGALDLREFSEEGLKLLGLGDLLACYFGDGVAFVRATGNPDAPYQRQILTTNRGLLSTHAVCAIDGNTHFGLFTDGWWLLDSSGRWQEVGITEIGGIRVTKWKETFYGRLDLNLLERIYVEYDERRRLVFITFPTEGSGASDPNEEVWIWDPRGDRIWIETYHATVFSSVNRQTQAATTVDQLDNLTTGGTIDELAGRTIDSFGAKFGVRNLVHGTYNGLVMQHDSETTQRVDLDTQASYQPSYKYRTVLSSIGSPQTLKMVRRMAAEFIQTGMGNPTFTAFCNGSQGSQSGTVDASVIGSGDTNVLWRHFRFTSPQLGVELSGEGPVEIQSFEVDLQDTGVEIRR